MNYIHANIQHKLILISAGAGYGKTSVLIQYAHDAALPICWYSLDPHDASVLTFAEYLLAAIRERFPGFGEGIGAYLRDHEGPAEDVEPLVRLFIHEIEEHTDRYFAIILDDYHEVIDSEPVNVFVDGLLRYLPEHCHLILASRAIPRRLTLTRLAARQEVVGLGVEEMRFTEEEIVQVLALLGYTDLAPEQIETLAHRTEGWITGILLAAQASRSRATGELLEIAAANAGVFDYLAAEILERQPPAVQRFLMGSALFTEMNPALCNALLDISDAGQILRDLAEQNLFTIPLDAEGAWYQYHQILREFLVARLEHTDPDAYRALSLKRARLMAQRGDWRTAVEGYVQAHAYPQAAEALSIIAPDSFGAGQWDQLKAWIDALPPAVLAEHPALMIFRAKVHTEAGELPQSAALLEQCRQAFLARGDAIGASHALTQVAVVHRYRGRLREAISTSREALALAGERDALTQVQASREIGICHCMMGQYAQGLAELSAALDAARAAADDVNAAYIALDMGTAEVSQGRLLEARQHYQQALFYWRRTGNEGTLALTLQNLGMVHHHLGQYTEAEDHFHEALAKAGRASDNRSLAYALTSLADLYRDTQRYGEAIAAYRQAQQVAADAQLALLHVYVLIATGDALRLSGDRAAARPLIGQALEQVEREDMRPEVGLAYLAQGALLLAEGDAPGAREALCRAIDHLSAVAATRDVARARLYLAGAALAEGEGATVRRELAEVTALAERLGTTQFVAAEAPALWPLLEHAERHGQAGIDYGGILVEAGRLARPAPEREAGRPRRPAPAIEFLALNGERVLVDGQPVTNWESTSARHLAFLRVGHPEGLRRDQAIEALWPEVQADKGNGIFHSTMYRVRSALSKGLMVRRGGVYRVNPALNVYYDVAEFERLARQGEGEDDLAHAARQEAIALYQTPYVETLDGDWARAQRERLHGEAMRLLLHEGRYLAERDEWDEAEAVLLRARRLEPYDERVHRAIMWCRARRGDRAGAIRQYQECARLLLEDLDAEPSPETAVLYRAIQSGAALPPLG